MYRYAMRCLHPLVISIGLGMVLNTLQGILLNGEEKENQKQH